MCTWRSPEFRCLTDGRSFCLWNKRQKDPKKAWEKQETLSDAARRLDLVFWIDAHKGICQPIKPAGAERPSEACDLFDIK